MLCIFGAIFLIILLILFLTDDIDIEIKSDHEIIFEYHRHKDDDENK